MRIRGGWVLAIACAATLLTSPAHAGSDDVDRYLTAASRLYENLEYERALDQLQRAKKVSRGVADDVEIALYEGILLAELGKRDDSIAAFKEALYLDADAKLPLKVSPKLTGQFEEIRRDVQQEVAKAAASSARRNAGRDGSASAAGANAQAAGVERSGGDPATAGATIADARSSANEPSSNLDHDARSSSDAPSKLTTIGAATPADAPAGGLPSSSAELASTSSKPSRVVPWVLGGVAVAAGGAGAFFGLKANGEIEQARAAEFQDDTAKHLAAAQTPALAANVLFAAAGTAAVGAAIAWFTSANDSTPGDAARP